MMKTCFTWLTILFASGAAAQPAPSFGDPKPQRYVLQARASVIDPQARPHPEINFVFEKDGKPADLEDASVDTRVAPQGRLVIWLMGPSVPLFERLNSYGLHAIRVHYANGWFAQFGKEPPPADEYFLGKIRLEAATGEDFSDAVSIPKPDGMRERARQFVIWLAKENPQGRWEQFLSADRTSIRWDRVIVSGASHGATTAARFAKHQRVDRVVMFCEPRARRRVDGPPLRPRVGTAGAEPVRAGRGRRQGAAALWRHAPADHGGGREGRRQARARQRDARRVGGEGRVRSVCARGGVALLVHASGRAGGASGAARRGRADGLAEGASSVR
jgi:hypothetical protein